MSVYFLKTNISKDNSEINWSSAPIQFTNDFSKEITFKDSKPELKDSGIEELKKNKLWIQIIDKNGEVSTSYDSPKEVSTHYSPIEMIELYKNAGDIKDCTVFVGCIESNGEEWTYVIGFPVKISKVIMYLNYNNLSNLKWVVLSLFAAIMFLILILGAVYGIWMNRLLSNIITSIKKLTSNSYVAIKKSGMYGDVYESLNLLHNKLEESELERRKNEISREEWISNISHDLKTPLSPIKGYAEMLSDSEYNVNSEEIKKYGGIILKNAVYVEALVEDLKLTYKLKNGMLILKKKDGNIVSLLKEIIINILNNPEYKNRNITFYFYKDKVNLSYDSILLQRALSNLINNAIIHNSPDTIIKVFIKEEDKIYIKIEDNGKGIGEKDLEKLFERYYRGANTDANVQGSGLGMAIAKQIIEVHDGTITVDSELNVGTSVDIEFEI
ncbi:sensor histidine kinase [Clostridium gelidum]|nr:HAMP domain-containing sensor histidine kinase [Clostridium gelidum]